MKRISTISEDQRMYITVIIAGTPRRSLAEFKESISDLNAEELKYLKQELNILVTRGNKQYLAAYNSL